MKSQPAPFPTPAPAGGSAAAEPVRDAPAFDFYPERWLVGVAGMSDAEQLSYLRLLCHQWLCGDAGLPPDVPALKRLGGKGVTPAVLAKLPLKADGRRRNARLEIVREEQRERIAKKSEQRRAAANKRWHGTPAATATPLRTPPAAGAPAAAAPACEAHAPSLRPHRESSCGTDAARLRPQRGSMCGPHAADMPTTHRPPLTTHPLPRDANNAGARAHEAAAAALTAEEAEAAAAWDCAADDAAAREAADAAADAAAEREASSTPRATPCAASTVTASLNAGRPAEQDAAATAGTADVPTPSLATVKAWAVGIGCPADKAEIWWHEHEARPLTAFGRWTDRDGLAVRSPQNALAAWWQKWKANDLQRATRLNPPSRSYHPAPRPATPRSDTANAPGRYA
ncbi:hypothetical protein [Prosthecobacter fluviatilis]|uniref:DUF1376 domain-containing protein n=1 Tax=Prosthecobacter fluviatilis TaxID=445931 RepID=A0ABW0KVD6_9BACT